MALPRRSAVRNVAAVALALASTTCTDGPSGPGGRRAAHLALQPEFAVGTNLAAFGIVIDSLRVIVVRPASDTLHHQTYPFPADSSDLNLPISINLIQPVETLTVVLEFRGGGLALFTGTQQVEVQTGPPGTNPAATIPVVYNGPGVGVDSLELTPDDSVLSFSDSLRFRVAAFQAGVPVTQFYVSWTTSDTLAAQANAIGLVRAPALRRGIYVTAQTPTGVRDSAKLTFQPVATTLTKVSGDIQSGLLGTLLSQPLRVRVTAADALGVRGIAVLFTAVTGGGSVATATVVTDSLGFAETAATLGGSLGANSFIASVAGLSGSPATFTATALAGVATQLAFTVEPTAATAGTAIAPAVVVTARDAQGNLAAGYTGTVTIAFGANPGSTTLNGVTAIPAAAGVATFSTLSLNAAASGYTLVASSGALTPDTSVAFGVAAAAAANIALVSGNSQNGFAGIALGAPIVVRVTDQFANPVPGYAGVAWATPSGGTLTPAGATNASGLTEAAWTLGAGLGSQTASATATGLTGSPIALSAIAAPVGTTITWTGAVSTDWFVAGNWSPSGIPQISDNVFIPAGPTNQPLLTGGTTITDLVVQTGATIATGAFPLNAAGNVDAGTSITGTGTLVLSGAGGVRGTVPNLFVSAPRTVSGPLIVTGDVTLNADLTIGGQKVVVSGSLVAGTGTVVMSVPADTVDVAGAASFHRATSTGLMSAGVLLLRGAFGQFQAGSGNGETFTASGTHKTVFAGTVAQTVNFANPGVGGSFFRDVEFANAAGVTFLTNVQMDGVATITAGTVTGAVTGIVKGSLADAAGGRWQVTNTAVDGTISLPDSLITDVTFGNGVLAKGFTTVGNAFFLGDVTISGRRMRVLGNLTGTSGTPVMTNPADTVEVTGDAAFQRGASTGLLNAGVLILRGNFAQVTAGSGNGEAFPASGAHKTVFAGSAAQSVSFANPGAGGSFFRDVEFANPSGVVFQTIVQMDGAAVITAGTVTGGVTGVVGASLADAAGGKWQVSATVAGGTISLPDSMVTALTLGAGVLAKSFTVTPDLVVQGDVTMGGHRIRVWGNLTTTTGSPLMTNAADTVEVSGTATFQRANALGTMTAGVLLLRGTFQQVTAGSGNQETFAASGTHKTVFANTTLQTISFQNPGSSYFQDLEIAGSGGLTPPSGAVAQGQLIVRPAVNPTIFGGGSSALTVAGLDVDGLTLDGVLLTSVNGTLTRFDNVTFQNYPTTVTQLTISHPGPASPIQFTNTTFQTTPTTGGFYISATDNNVDANFLTINMVGAVAANGPGFTQVFNGGVVNWSNVAFTVNPGTVTAGIAIAPPVQVTVNFAGGGVDTTYTNTVTLTLGANPGGATLGGTTAKAAVAGVATFDDLTLDKAAAGYTLQAAASGVGTVLSTTFTVVAGAASTATSLVSVASPSVGVGLTDSLFLQTRDAFDNVLTTGGATVLFTQSGTGTGTISPTTDNGDGTYTAIFTATALGPVTIGATIGGSPVTTTLPTLNVVTVSTAHSADITTNETWTAAQSPHIVTGYLRVRNGATLTIESGATVKFDAAAGLQVGDTTLGEAGTLNMVGSPSEILLTANTGTPTPGFWKGIEVQRQGTFLPWINVTFEYGGSARPPIPPTFTAPESCLLMVGSSGAVIQVDSSRFRHCVHAGIHHFDGTLVARKNLFDSTTGSAIHADFSALLQADSNVFQNSGNEGLQILSPIVALAATGNQFLNNGAFGASLFATQLDGFHRQAAISGNGNDSIYVQGGRVNTSVAAFTIEAQPAPYLVDGLIQVGRSAAGGATVTLDSGLVLVFASGGLQVGDTSGTQRGQIRSRGTASNPTVLRERPGGGAWRGVGLGLSAGPDTLRHVQISHGGGSGGVFGAATAANLTIYKPTAATHFYVDSIVSDQSAAAGIVVARASALVSPRHRVVRSTITNSVGDGLVISTTGTQPTVLDSLNTFSGIGGFPLVLSGHALAGHTAQASIDTTGPGPNDILITSGQVFITNVQPPAQIPYATADSALLLQGGGGTFTLDPNLVMKFGRAAGLVIGDSAVGPSATIVSLGTNRTNAPLLTSRQAVPQPGDWYGLEIGRLASNTRLANVRIEYAGDSIPGRNPVRFGLWVRNAQPQALEIDSVVLVKNGAPQAPGRAVAGLLVTGAGSGTDIRRSVVDTTQGGIGIGTFVNQTKVVGDTARGNEQAGIAVKLLFGASTRAVTDSVAGNVVTGNGTYPLDLVPGVLQGVHQQAQVTGNVRDTILVDGPGLISDTARLWKYAGVPYRVTGMMLIDSGGALTVEPGDTVVFDDSVSIQVGVFGTGAGGRLRAVSSSTAPILLTANPAAPGRWFGIVFFNITPDGYTAFQNVVIEKAWHFLPCFGDCSPPAQPSLIVYSQSGATLPLDSITVRGGQAGALLIIDVATGTVAIDHSQFYQNPFDPMIQGPLGPGTGSRLTIHNSDLYHYRGNAIRGFYGGGQTGSPADTIDASNNWWGDIAGPNEFSSFSDSLGRASLDQNAVRYQTFATAPFFPVGPAAALQAATDTMVPGDTVGQVIDFSFGPSPDSIRVRVLDALGRAVPGHGVSWAALSGSATPSGGTSDPSGRVATQWTSGTAAGPAELTADGGLGPLVRFHTTLFADSTATTQWRLVQAGPGGTIATDSLSVSYTSSNRPTVIVTRAFDQYGNPTQPSSGYFYTDVPFNSGFQFYGVIDSISQDSLVYFRPRSAVPGSYQFHALYNGGLIEDSVLITITPNVAGVGIDRDPFALGVQDTGTVVVNSLCPFNGAVNPFCAKSYTAYVVDSGGAPLSYGGAFFSWSTPLFPDTSITNDSTQGANGEIAYIAAHGDGPSWLVAVDVPTGRRDSLPILVDQIGRIIQLTPDTGIQVLVGQTGTFTAAVLDDGGQPLANDTIHFRTDPFEKLTIADTSILNQVTVHLDSTPFGITSFEAFWARPAADSVYGYFPNDTVFGTGFVTNPVGVPLTTDVTPDAVAIDEQQNRIFVSHLGGLTLAVIDGVGDTLTQSVPIGEATRGLAVNPKTGIVYVAGASGPGMHVLEDISGSYNVTGSVSIGPSQGGIAIDTARNRIYVPSNHSGAEWLTVVDGATNTVIDSIPLAHPGGAVAYNPATDRIYVALPQIGTPFDTLMVIDAATLTKVDSIEVGDMPAGIAFDPATNAVYVSNQGSHQLTHIDGATNTVIITVATGFFGPGRIGFDPVKNHLWVSTQSTFVEVFDAGLTFLGAPNVGQTTADAKVNPVTGTVYLTVPNLDAVRILKF